MKEVARQISELVSEDYTVLESGALSLQSCNVSFDIFEPIAIQLSALIDQLRLDGPKGSWTSDSGAVSDYDSSSVYDDTALHGEDMDMQKTTTDYEAVPSNQSLNEKMEIKESDEVRLSDASHLLVEDSKTDDMDSMELNENDKISGGIEENSDGAFWSKIKGIEENEEETAMESKMSSISTPDLHPENVQSGSSNEAIMVTDLEKEFFSLSDSSEELSPEKYPEQNTSKPVSLNIRRKSGILRSRAIKSTTRRICDGDEEKRVSNNSRGGDNAGNRGQMYNGTSYGNRNHNSRKWATQRQNSRGGFRPHHGRDHKNKSRGLGDGGDSMEFKNGSQSTERKDSKENSLPTSQHQCVEAKSIPISHQPSPLVLHSQNMWSANMDVIKSHTRRFAYHKHRARDNKRSATTFNHHEVASFLLDGKIYTAFNLRIIFFSPSILGWEQVQREFATLFAKT